MNRTVNGDNSLSYTLVCAVAEFEECCPHALPPLQDTLDVDALNRLFSSETDEHSKLEGNLAFQYSDSFVSVWSDRLVTVSIAPSRGN
ncbi:HalOD1 output domain-containing protein [Halorarius litoreus]|uniref:HalOD1 output domain-containing protein n=1 Tax=Halorarius litoreus TaxID=2962676 RepID=UPI003313A47D